MKHKNIPIFIPHLGCKMQCSFCNQKHITGKIKPITLEEIKNIINESIEYIKNKYGVDSFNSVQIAFFGGSFTAIDKQLMLEYLTLGKHYVEKYNLNGIRISTRPDCINDEILDILSEYKVNSIELGVQSLDEEVLLANKRGHTYFDAVNAVKLIKQRNISLGLQMMIGLYLDNYEKLMETAKKIIEFKPDEVRIYPTVILKDTYLEQLFHENKYIPISLDESIEYTVKLMKMFLKENIKILKVGLHASDLISFEMIGGLYHPNYKELCDSKIYFEKLSEKLANKPKGEYEIYIKTGHIPKVIGYKKENEKYFYSLGYRLKLIEKDNILDYMIVIN